MEKNNIKKIIFRSILIAICVLISFYIIYKLSNALLLVITGAFLLLIGSFIKDKEPIEEKKEEVSNLTQLTIFSEEVLEPSIIKEEKKTKKVEKAKEVINIENTNSYDFDKVKINKSKKIKA